MTTIDTISKDRKDKALSATSAIFSECLMSILNKETRECLMEVGYKLAKSILRKYGDVKKLEVNMPLLEDEMGKEPYEEPHKGEYKYHCKVCSYATDSWWALQVHIGRQHPW